MIKRAFCFFLLFLSLLNAAYEKELNAFDTGFASSKDKQRMYLELKNFYIQSIINEDEKSKIELLKRLIIGANALNLDDSEYVSELRGAGFKESYIKNLQNAYKQDDSLKLKPVNNEKNTTNKTQNTENKENRAVSKESEKPSKPFVLKVLKLENGAQLNLNFKLDEKDIKKSALKEKDRIRYIFDFSAALDTGASSFKIGEVNFNIAQFDTKTTRIVLSSKADFNYDLELENKNLILKIGQNKEKEQEKPKTQAQKSSAKENTKENTKENLTKSNEKIENEGEKKRLYILSNKSTDTGLLLNLNRALDENELKIVSFKDKNLYRKIISFEGVLEGGRKNLTFNKNFITLTQYTPKVVRIVLSSPNDFELFKDFEDKKVFFGFEKTDIAKTNTKNTANSSKTSTSSKNSPKSSKATQSANQAKGKIIVIDAGHGGKDVGAINGKLYEKNIVLSVALKLGKELQSLGYKVFYTRSNDKFINLRDRTKLANDKRANLFISIHANAAPNKSKADSMQGVETFFLSPARSERSKQVAEKENQADLEEANFFLKQNFLSALSREKIIASNRLAIDIQKNLLASVRKRYKVVDGAVREAPFWVLVGAQDMPAVLIEIGYITHPSESKRLASSAYQQLLAEGIADGVQNYFINNP